MDWMLQTIDRLDGMHRAANARSVALDKLEALAKEAAQQADQHRIAVAHALKELRSLYMSMLEQEGTK